MPVPDYQTIMLPFLTLLADGKEYVFKHIIQKLSIQFELTEDDMNQLLPSGQSFIFDNRVGWARTSLKKAGLLDSPKKSMVAITPRGIDILNKKPAKIDNSLLKQFPEFLEFQNLKRENTESALPVENSLAEKQTPEEVIDDAYQNIRQSLALELIDTIRGLSPAFFERLVVELLVKTGYGGSIKDAGKAMGKTGG